MLGKAKPSMHAQCVILASYDTNLLGTETIFSATLASFAPKNMCAEHIGVVSNSVSWTHVLSPTDTILSASQTPVLNPNLPQFHQNPLLSFAGF